MREGGVSPVRERKKEEDRRANHPMNRHAINWQLVN